MKSKYPSRVYSEPKILERKDPVVYTELESNDAVTSRDKEFFEKNGFLICDELFTREEVQLYNTEFEKMAADPVLNKREEFIREPASKIVRSIFYVHKLSEIFNKLSDDERIKKVVEFLLDSQTYVHQSRINAKPGFTGKEFYWHSDFETWHIEDGMPHMRAISCLITLTENKSFNGSLMFFPGSHKKFVSCVGETPDDHYKESLRKQEYGVPDPGSLQQFYDDFGIKVCEGKPGSVIFFDCNLMHGSNGNITPLPRRNVFFVYNSIKNRLVEPFGGMKPRPNFIGERKN